MATESLQAPLDTLYREMFERGVKYCLPAGRLTRSGSASPSVARLVLSSRDDGGADLTWLGSAYRLEHPDRALTGNETRLLRTIGRVLSARYHALLESAGAARVVRDASELSRELRRLLADPDLRAKLGDAGYEAVASRHGTVRDTLDLIDRYLYPGAHP